MSSSNLTMDLLRYFAAGVYLSETKTPTWGEGGSVEPEKRGERQQFTKLVRNYQHDWQYLQSINCDKYLPQSAFTGKIFLDDDILLGVCIVN